MWALQCLSSVHGISQGYSENPKRHIFSTHVALYMEFSTNTPGLFDSDNDRVKATTTAMSKEAKKVTNGNEEHIRS
jgi:hypothetical protein